MRTKPILLGSDSDYRPRLVQILKYYTDQGFKVSASSEKCYKISKIGKRNAFHFQLIVDFSQQSVIAYLELSKIPIVLLSILLIVMVGASVFNIEPFDFPFEFILFLILSLGYIFILDPWTTIISDRKKLSEFIKFDR